MPTFLANAGEWAAAAIKLRCFLLVLGIIFAPSNRQQNRQRLL